MINLDIDFLIGNFIVEIIQFVWQQKSHVFCVWFFNSSISQVSSIPHLAKRPMSMKRQLEREKYDYESCYCLKKSDFESCYCWQILTMHHVNV